MPRNTAAGVVISAFALVLGFALIWHIWWMSLVGFAGVVVTLIVRSFNEDVDYYVSVDEVARIEDERYRQLEKHQLYDDGGFTTADEQQLAGQY